MRRSWLRRQQFNRQAAFIRRNYVLLAGAVGAFAILLVLAQFIPTDRSRFFLSGAIVASAIWTTWLLVALVSGSINYRYGTWGEDATRDELKKLRKAGWRFVQGLYLKGGDVDVIAVGPGGVVALEVKWMNEAPKNHQLTDRKTRYLQQAKRNGYNLHQILTPRGFDLFVEPLVVVWGAGCREFVESAKDASIVKGHDVRKRLLARRHILDTEQIETITGLLSRYADFQQSKEL